jgi:hypothetical protein
MLEVNLFAIYGILGIKGNYNRLHKNRKII